MRLAQELLRAIWRSDMSCEDGMTCLTELICFLAVKPSAPRVRAAAANMTRKKVLSLLASIHQSKPVSRRQTYRDRSRVDFGLLD
jgi:hypothetical protein